LQSRYVCNHGMSAITVCLQSRYVCNHGMSAITSLFEIIEHDSSFNFVWVLLLTIAVISKTFVCAIIIKGFAYDSPY
ncbi:MAG: hypothetical protein AAFR83_20840, partial [Cyanobacteria bacterium J06629_18]